ncbi:MAG: DPP IV N-terminal domain-containing protein [Cytophagales bacterium]|nr:DPP IV N-terminal domain-containing protein [Cytophagales bacterium]
MRRILCALSFLSILTTYAQVWSPDGSQLAFFYIHAIEDIYLVNTDGSNFQVLDQHPERDFMPDWSPEGNSLIFTSVRDGNHQIYRMDLATRETERLIVSDDEDTDGHFSSDGKKVVFSSNRSGNSDLFIYDLEDKTISALTQTSTFEYTPRWSPDGKKILYKMASDEFGASDLYVMDIKTRQKEQVTIGQRGEFHQNWSPGGDKICYVQVTEGVFELWVLDIKTREKQVLVKKEGYQLFYPNWSPDGQFIAFTRDLSEGQQEGYPALYMVNMEGKESLVSAENSFE